MTQLCFERKPSCLKTNNANKHISKSS